MKSAASVTIFGPKVALVIKEGTASPHALPEDFWEQLKMRINPYGYPPKGAA